MSYCGYIVSIKELRKHPNADRLQIATVFGNDVIVGLDYKVGQMCVYFPTDGQLSEEFCRVNDLVERKDEEGNRCGGYLSPTKRNVKAINLRGAKSDGLLLPVTSLAEFTTISDLKVGDQITTLGGIEICKKYIPRRKVSGVSIGSGGMKRAKANHAPTFYEHVDTEQLAYHLDAFKPGDIVELTEKLHGTSGRTGYLPVNKQKNRTLLDKILRRPGKVYTEYDYVTGTRRVVLDEKHSGGFYEDNSFRQAMAKKFEGKLHKGEVAYYEIVGFVNENSPIMASCNNKKIQDKEFVKLYGETTTFSYGCDPKGDYEPLPAIVLNEDNVTWRADSNDILKPRCDVYVYRMTQVSEDGFVTELSPEQMRYRCEQMGINVVPHFETFMIPDLGMDIDGNGEDDIFVVSPGEYVLRKVEQYFDGPSTIDGTHIREGVVARIVNKPNISVYKHKNFEFKVLESIVKDEREFPDMEEAQEILNEENPV